MIIALLIIGAGLALFLCYCGSMWWHRNQPMPAAAHVTRGHLPQAMTATVIPNRVAPPPQQLAVSFWEPKPVRGELEP